MVGDEEELWKVSSLKDSKRVCNTGAETLIAERKPTHIATNSNKHQFEETSYQLEFSKSSFFYLFTWLYSQFIHSSSQLKLLEFIMCQSLL